MLLLPGWLVDKVVYDTHDKIRRAALKKRDAAAKSS